MYISPVDIGLAYIHSTSIASTGTLLTDTYIRSLFQTHANVHILRNSSSALFIFLIKIVKDI